jgi:cellulose synthase/poly-beta-1,6-N-acetylglucosamine synthase-like glycosyltransferase
MCYTLLNQLPAPPFNKTGWPWTEVSPALPVKMDDGSPWPKISIVTPSLNHGQFIEETIRSILLQDYPNLECIIIDAGSKDNTFHIIINIFLRSGIKYNY